MSEHPRIRGRDSSRAGVGSAGRATPSAAGSSGTRTLTPMSDRRFVFPQDGDDLASIASRELPDVEGAEQQLLSWNLHLAARAGLGRSVGLLPSDVVFLEPPPAT